MCILSDTATKVASKPKSGEVTIMRTKIIATVLGFVVLGWASTSSGVVCGDANSDDQVNLLDLLSIIDYLRVYPQDPPIDLDNADVDGVHGVTVSDAIRMSNRIFFGTPLNCDDSATFSYPLSPDDTVFFPRMLGISDSTDSVSLPVIMSLQASVQGFYVPFLHHGFGSDSLFDYTGADIDTFTILVAGDELADTSILIGVDVYKNQFQGRNEMFTLRYNRVAPGTSDVRPEPTDRSSRFRIAVEINNELFVPVIEYYDIESPPEVFPWGDLDCDGETNVADLTLLIGYLFLGELPGTPCK
jgi:hypothetical protein